MYYTWESAIPVAECEKIIEKYKDEECSAGVIGNAGEQDLDKRDAAVHWLDNGDLLNRTIMSFMQEANEKFFKYNMDGSETLQFATYKVGGKYCWHTDTTSLTTTSLRKLSTIVQLSNPDDYEGGKFEFFKGEDSPEELNIKKQGAVIVFDSRDWHRLTPITKGVRYSLAQWSQGARFV